MLKTISDITFCDNYNNFKVMNVPAAAIDKLLDKFFKDVHKENGGEYESDSISSFQKSIQRHLKGSCPSISSKMKNFIISGKCQQPSEKIS